VTYTFHGPHIVNIDYLELEPRGPDLIDAWSEYDATAPEGADLPEAVQFRDVLEVPATPEERQSLLEEYEKALPDRISDEICRSIRLHDEVVVAVVAKLFRSLSVDAIVEPMRLFAEAVEDRNNQRPDIFLRNPRGLVDKLL